MNWGIKLSKLAFFASFDNQSNAYGLILFVRQVCSCSRFAALQKYYAYQ